MLFCRGFGNAVNHAGFVLMLLGQQFLLFATMVGWSVNDCAVESYVIVRSDAPPAGPRRPRLG